MIVIGLCWEEWDIKGMGNVLQVEVIYMSIYIY